MEIEHLIKSGRVREELTLEMGLVVAEKERNDCLNISRLVQEESYAVDYVHISSHLP